MEHWEIFEKVFSSETVFGKARKYKDALTPMESFIIGLVLFKRFRGGGTFRGGCDLMGVTVSEGTRTYEKFVVAVALPWVF